MSYHTRPLKTLIESHPAYDLIALRPERNKLITLHAGMHISIGTKAQPEYIMGSVVSYALMNGECPIVAYNQEVSRGFDTHWVSNTGSCITNQSQKKTERMVVQFGERVNFEGRVFEIVPRSNNNIGLKFIAMFDRWNDQRAINNAESSCKPDLAM